MKSVSRLLFIFLILSLIVFYILVNYFHSQLPIKVSRPTAGVKIRDSEQPIVMNRVELLESLHYHEENGKNGQAGPAYPEKRSEIVLAVVACGDRLAETLVMIKSAILFSLSPLHFIVFADDPLVPSFKEKLNEWIILSNHSFTFQVYPITFPLQENKDEWRKLFKPCASQRLFLPSVLEDVDSLLYVDTDTLFLSPLEDIWQHFSLMNSSQMAALTPEHEEPSTGWYNRFAKHPYYGQLGVNSGVMLMNLTRMRAFRWTNYVVPIYKEYKLKITWGDQDIINILFHFHPDKLYLYPCRYNYRPDHCMYMSVCKSAEKEGVAVLHGSRGSFHAEKQPVFRAIYRAMEEYQLGTDPYVSLFITVRNYLEMTTSNNCGKIRHIFTKSMQHFFKDRFSVIS